MLVVMSFFFFFFFQAEDGIRDYKVTGVQTCALPILWQTPVAAVLTRTSRPHGLSISIDSIVRGSCTFRKTAAFVSMPASLQSSSSRKSPAQYNPGGR